MEIAGTLGGTLGRAKLGQPRRLLKGIRQASGLPFYPAMPVFSTFRPLRLSCYQDWEREAGDWLAGDWNSWPLPHQEATGS